jgi:hypothetical protein
MKPLDYISGGNTLAIYTYLTGDARSENPVDITDGPSVEYQVRAHFEWNPHHAALAGDRVDGKHYAIAKRRSVRDGFAHLGGPNGAQLTSMFALLYTSDAGPQMSGHGALRALATRTARGMAQSLRVGRLI